MPVAARTSSRCSATFRRLGAAGAVKSAPRIRARPGRVRGSDFFWGNSCQDGPFRNCAPASTGVSRVAILVTMQRHVLLVMACLAFGLGIGCGSVSGGNDGGGGKAGSGGSTAGQGGGTSGGSGGGAAGTGGHGGGAGGGTA